MPAATLQDRGEELGAHDVSARALYRFKDDSGDAVPLSLQQTGEVLGAAMVDVPHGTAIDPVDPLPQVLSGQRHGPQSRSVVGALEGDDDRATRLAADDLVLTDHLDDAVQCGRSRRRMDDSTIVIGPRCGEQAVPGAFGPGVGTSEVSEVGGLQESGVNRVGHASVPVPQWNVP